VDGVELDPVHEGVVVDGPGVGGSPPEGFKQNGTSSIESTSIQPGPTGYRRPGDTFLRRQSRIETVISPDKTSSRSSLLNSI